MFTLKVANYQEKVAFSAGIRLPESRRNLSQISMYVTMADSASRKFSKIFLSPKKYIFI